MATTLPAMRGKFGSTEYYVVTMRAQELANQLVIPKEMEEWEDMTLEERFQREVNYQRVKKHIAPYLANDQDRFFGAFIVDIWNSDGVSFEPLNEVVGKKMPGLYRSAAESFGFLNMQGNEVLVPLDGQHRLAAIRFAISGKDERQKDIDGLTPNMDIANDYCTVIMIQHDPKKARKIFNKVNRYAKATSKADNLITADDDIVAVISREEVADKLIHERIVNYSSNTLSKTSKEFTTLATLYEATGLILEETHGKIDRKVLPSEADQKVMREEAREFWSKLLDGVNVFKLALQDDSENGDGKRREIRETYILGKPIVQLALVDAVLRLHAQREDGARLALDTIIERVNAVEWRSDNPIWQRVLMNGDRVATGRQAAKFGARFVAYLLGEPLHDKELSALEEQYLSQFSAGEQPKGLPDRLFAPPEQAA